jgi:hypothetical protein
MLSSPHLLPSIVSTMEGNNQVEDVMSIRSSRNVLGTSLVAGMVLLSAGCGLNQTGGMSSPAIPSPGKVSVPLISGSRAVVEEYLKAASEADGAKMYALIASSERESESPKTLKDTADDRYSTATSWEVLKTEEGESSSKVIVQTKSAKVEPNPYTFTLTKEAGEWRIVQSPELHEEEKDGRIRIKL